MKRTFSLFLAAFAVLLAACGSGGGASSTGALGQKTPSQVLSGAIAAAKKAGTVHFRLLGTESGKTETIIGDASDTDGREIITAGTIKIQALVIAGAAYIEGNAGGLEDQVGLSTADATTYAGKWISIATTDTPYKSLTAAVTLASTLAELQPKAPLAFTAATTKASHPVIGVKGGLPGSPASGTSGTATLYVATSGPGIPVVFSAQESNSGSKESDVGTFSNWGKPLHLVAPTNTVPFASLPAPTTPSTTTPAG
jgi:hypothetical protein